MSHQLKQKKEGVIRILKQFDALAIAFSGGVDSTLLLSLAHEVLGENVVALTASSPLHPAHEMELAAHFAKQLGVRHIIVKSRELTQPAFLANPKDRCYICKKIIFTDLKETASAIGIKNIAHGANQDDLSDYRPGYLAACEMGVAAPLVEAKLTKDEIRLLSKQMGLSTWNKPALACLASRIPYGTPITEKALKMVERAEAALSGEGFSECRVRHHGEVARIEIRTEEFDKIFSHELREKIVSHFKEIGFLHVSIDMEGYVQGSLNRSLIE